jgi:SAM-dependent methyltransferase
MSHQQHFTNDGGRNIDWSRTSDDYAQHRPDYPAEFYDQLAEQGIGLPDQRILDLGTGVGFLAQKFAKRGAQVTGVDPAPGQIEVARRRATDANLSIDYQVAAAEQTNLPKNTFDVVTASQCWLYFDKPRATAEARRVLKPHGLLAISHLCWLPLQSDIAKRSEDLVLQYNPDWTGAKLSNDVPHDPPEYFKDEFEQIELIVFDAEIPFTHESWRGRWRACRGVGATLSPAKIARFDREHAELLARTVDAEFTVLHRIDCRILQTL